MLNKIAKKIYGSQVTYDANIGYYYDFVHNANSDEILIGVYDDAGKLMNTNGLFARIDSNTLRIFFPNTSVNYWTAYVFYEDDDTVETAPKKRLFEQTEIAAGDLGNYLDYKLAMGGPGMATYNISLAQFKTFCQASLDTSLYLLKANNLSDLTDASTARNNLDVYSKAQVDSFLIHTVPLGGYVNSFGTTIDTGAFNNLTVVATKDTRGVNLDIQFDAPAGTYTEQLFCVVPVIANTGVTFDIADDYFPLFIGHSDGSYTFGQVKVSGTTTLTGAYLNIYASLYTTSTLHCSCMLHYTVNKA